MFEKTFKFLTREADSEVTIFSPKFVEIKECVNELNQAFAELTHLRAEVERLKLADKKTGLFYEDGDPICIGDEVKLITGVTGEIVYECGVYGFATAHCIDYDKIQQVMDSLPHCCGNKYNGCVNDNFVSLWELYQNFNCEEDVLDAIEKLEDGDNIQP